MPSMTKKERVRAALRGAPVDHPPVSLWGHDYLREWSAEDLVAATLERYRAYDWDFIKLNPRWTHFAEAWGNRYEAPVEQRNPRTLAVTVETTEDLAALRPVGPDAAPFAEQLTALRLLLAEVGDEVDVVQTVFSPLAIVGLLVGRPADLIALADADAAALHHACAAVGETLTDYARAVLTAGASGLFYAPLTWASRDTCSEAFYREFGRPYDLQFLHATRDAEFNILHVCRDHNMLDLLLDYPVAAFNWDAEGVGNASLGAALARTDKAVMGGISRDRLAEMPPGEVAATAEAVRALGSTRLFVTASCSIPPATPPENLVALVRTVRGEAA